MSAETDLLIETNPTLAIAATFTAEPLEPTLSFWLEKLGQPQDVAFASFNQVFQALLEPGSATGRAQWAAVVLIRFEDWIEGDKTKLAANEWNARLSPLIDEFLTAVGNGRKTPLIIIVCPPSPAVSREATVVLAAMEDRIVGALAQTPGVHGFKAAAVSDLYPVDVIHDPQSDAIGTIPYTLTYFAALATFVIRMAHALRRPPFKVIALDCDNTLWSGVCGEGGVRAVSIGSGHRGLQRFLSEQSEAGKLLCLTSKNVEDDVFHVFDQHPDMSLQRTKLVGHRINWLPKSRNLRDLSKELNLGLDSFILIDDNPIECAEVRANAPEVLTLQLPVEENRIEQFIRHVWALDQLDVTDQDRKRTRSYLPSAQRASVRTQSASLEDFLQNLEQAVTFTPIDASHVSRAAQMIDRTNQFNASTIRRSEAELQELLCDGKYKAEIIQVKDRFGDYGVVGLVISRSQRDALVVDTFLLSCRVLGRAVEHQMLARLGHIAIAAGLQYVDVPFVRTKKNQPVLDFLNAVGLDYRNPADGGFLFHLPASFAEQVKASITRSAVPNETEAAPDSATGDERSAAMVPYQQIADHWADAEQIYLAVEARRRKSRQRQATGFLAPRTPQEQRLADIWGRVLGIEPIGIDDDYFELGGTSVMAVYLVLQIEKVFHQRVPIATLLAAPTVRLFAERMGDSGAGDDSAIVTLRAEGQGPPLFLFPGIGGHVMSFRRLAQLLDTNQPVYGIEMRPEDPRNRVPRSMETIASETVDRLLKREPDGPYFLAGWSFGGALAFEVAHQLRQRGKQIGTIALLDTFASGYPRTLPLKERTRRHIQHFFRLSCLEQVRYVATTAIGSLNVVWHNVLLQLGVRKSDYYIYGCPLIEQFVKVCDDAWQAYRAPRWPGRLTLLRATQRPERIGVSYDDPCNGWNDLADEIEVRLVNTHHLGLFDEPVVEQTATELGKSICAAEEGLLEECWHPAPAKTGQNGSSRPAEFDRRRLRHVDRHAANAGLELGQ